MIGGTGVLSSAVTKEAIRHGIDVIMINRGHNMKAVPSNVELIKTDRSDYKFIASVLKGRYFDAVIEYLIVSEKQIRESFEFYKDYTKQYFFISSCAVYDTRTGKPCDEDSKKELPIWSYSVEKWRSEKLLMKLAEGYDTNITIIRPCITYGNSRIPYGISPKYGYHWTLAARILAGKPIVRWNKGENRSNMTRVEDFAVGVVGLIGNTKAYNDAFNVCGEETPTYNDVIDTMSTYLGNKAVTIDIDKEFYAKEIPERRGELLGGRCIDAINNNDKIKAVVPEFKQNIFIKEGIKLTLDAYNAENYQKGIDWAFDADTDRIILKWCKQNKIDAKQYNLEFVDYLGTATPNNKRQYWLTMHKRNLFIIIYNQILYYSHALVRKITK